MYRSHSCRPAGTAPIQAHTPALHFSAVMKVPSQAGAHVSHGHEHPPPAAAGPLPQTCPCAGPRFPSMAETPHPVPPQPRSKASPGFQPSGHLM